MSRQTTPTSEPSISNDELSDLILAVFAKVNPSGYKTVVEFEDHADMVSGFPTLDAYEDLGASCMIFCAQECGSLIRETGTSDTTGLNFIINGYRRILFSPIRRILLRSLST